jgi:hypothetical protein
VLVSHKHVLHQSLPVANKGRLATQQIIPAPSPEATDEPLLLLLLLAG